MKLSVSSKKLRTLALATAMMAAVATHAEVVPETIEQSQYTAPETAQPGTRQWQVTAEQRSSASLAAQNGVHVSEIRTDAPLSYRIQPGDTLWSISAKFLNDPWNWPALWGMNQGEIKNPHRIYPNQVLVLTRNGERATLRVGNVVGANGTATGNDISSSGMPVVRLSPRVRSQDMADAAIPVLPPDAVIPFLEHGIIVPRNEFENSPRIVALPDQKLISTVGDKVYVRGGHIDPTKGKIYMIYATPEPIRDPVTNDVLGFQADYLGKLQYLRSGAASTGHTTENLEVPSTFVITEAKREIRVGDRLTAASTEQDLLTDFIPSAAPANIKGRVVHIYGGRAIRHASRYQVVLLNQGHLDGLERGNVVALWSAGKELRDTTLDSNTDWGETYVTNRQNRYLRTPDERYGLAMVFRTYDHLSYAIIMQASDTVDLGDNFTTP